MNNLYKNIEQLCKQNNLTVGKLCSKINISRGNLSDLKTGRKKTLSSSNLKKISEYFNVSINDLLDAEDQKTPSTSNSDVENEAETMEFAKKLYSVLLEFGYIEEGQTLTDKQITFLRSHFNTLALFLSDE